MIEAWAFFVGNTPARRQADPGPDGRMLG
ncbi:MAG: hypothetical protein UZ13_02086, partial [Chloroflexi bacterium OLB13]